MLRPLFSLSSLGRRLRLCCPFTYNRIIYSHSLYYYSTRRSFNSNSNFSQTTSGDASNLNIHTARYEPIEDVEPFERYAPGGYYPVRIGDLFGRYRIIHKLGYGASSTIWLARDESLSKYVAIKFAIAELDRPFESAILKRLWEREGPHDSLRMNTIPEILDEFQVQGPEIEGTMRKHHCLVTTAARISVSEAREASYTRLFKPLVARAIAAQLIRAIAYMHSRGIIHGGT